MRHKGTHSDTILVKETRQLAAGVLTEGLPLDLTLVLTVVMLGPL